MERTGDVISRLDRIEALLLNQVGDRPLSFEEAKRYLNIASSTLYKLTGKKRLRHFKAAGKLVFRKSDLDNFLLGSPIQPATTVESQKENDRRS